MSYQYLIEDFKDEGEVYRVYAEAVRVHPHKMIASFAEQKCPTCFYRLNLSGKVTDHGPYQSASIQFQNVHEYTPEEEDSHGH